MIILLSSFFVPNIYRIFLITSNHSLKADTFESIINFLFRCKHIKFERNDVVSFYEE